jgi:hypothetical protein
VRVLVPEVLLAWGKCYKNNNVIYFHSLVKTTIFIIINNYCGMAANYNGICITQGYVIKNTVVTQYHSNL